jgi:hypothetical protein
MARDTELLIERLAADVRPVRPLRPPGVRAGLWLLVVGAVVAAAIAVFSDLDLFWRRMQDPKLIVELMATLLTGIAAVVAAFHLSLPDRSSAWAWLPLPFLALWLVTSGYSCYRIWLVAGPDGWTLGESAHCFRFILAVGLPLGASLSILLRHAFPMRPVRVAAVGGLGVAAIAAFTLQFFHPFDVTFMDLGVHLIAIGLVVAVMSLMEFFAPARPIWPAA